MMLNGTLATVITLLEESAHTVGSPTDDPELFEQFDGNLEDADASASQAYASACRSFQEARELLSRAESARGYFHVFGTLVILTAWLSQPLIANLQSLVARARRERGRQRLLRTKMESFQTLVHLESCQNHRPHVRSLVHLCSRSVRPKLPNSWRTTSGSFGFVLISACCVAK